MATDKIKTRRKLYLSVLGLLAFLLISLHLMSSATQEASELNEMYSWLLLINSLGSLLLLGLVSANAWWLFQQFRKNAVGSRLTVRIVLLFILLSLAPSSAVFYYSMQFLHRSIDSWFDVQVDQAMDEALQLSQASLDERMRNLLKLTEQMANSLDAQSNTLLAIELDDLRIKIDASELTLFSKSRQVIAYSSNSPELVPNTPDNSMLLQLRNGGSFVGLEPGKDDSLFIQVIVTSSNKRDQFLLALYPVSSRIGTLANSIEANYAHYKERTYLRDSLKFTFSLTLSLILLLSLLATIWVAFITSRRLVAPARELIQGTRAVAEGDYTQQLTIKRRDELGFLVESFNEMTRRIALSRDIAKNSQLEVESQRNYFETILRSLSTGVISFDADLNIKSANRAACKILHLEEPQLINQPLQKLSESSPNITRLINTVQTHITQNEERWQKECTVLGDEGRQLLMIRGTPLYNSEQVKTGSLIIFDDVTALMQAQRNAAWGEVARRLAHEIKNPLTPIQLSAERLKHKLSKVVDGTNADLLNRSTNTIIQQVGAMKTMVNEFADYARPPAIKTESTKLESLIKEILPLYQSDQFHLQIAKEIPPISVDPIQIRQVFHNLIKNSLEASDKEKQQQIKLTLEVIKEQEKKYAQVTIEDNGAGLSTDQLEHIFDPYVTTKEKGTGLGLAIVKKIIDEHGGIIWADPTCQTGARFIFRLPYSQPRRTNI
jgi:PAS domain S-box-containing protein